MMRVGLGKLLAIAAAAGLIVVTGVYATHAAGGADVKVTNDNNDVNGGV